MIRGGRLVALGLLAAALAAGAQAQTTYRWVDQNGRVQYSDQPPPPSAKRVEEKRFRSEAADTVDSYSVRRVAADFPVTLYTAGNCGEPCELARNFLQRRGVPFSERALADDTEMAAYRERFGTPEEVPAVTVGSTAMKGFEAGAWGRALDDVGYPKTPPPRQ